MAIRKIVTHMFDGNNSPSRDLQRLIDHAETATFQEGINNISSIPKVEVERDELPNSSKTWY